MEKIFIFDLGNVIVRPMSMKKLYEMLNCQVSFEDFYEYLKNDQSSEEIHKGIIEGFWWQDGIKGTIDYNNKGAMHFISIIRLPDFVTKADFDWAVEEATKKKKQDFSRVEFLTYDEGVCVQCMHIGSYDDEPTTVNLMHEFAKENGYELDITDTRLHHEIYLSDPRKCDINKLKTVIRHPIKKLK